MASSFSESILSATNSALSTIRAKSEEFNARNLRSRQRNSYYRMIDCVPTLVGSIYTLLCYLLSIIIRVQTLELSSFEKRLKKLLSCCENIASQAGVDKNKWDVVLVHCNSINDILTAAVEVS